MGMDPSSEIVIELTPKKLFALSLLVLVGGGAIFSYVVAIFAFNAPTQDLSMRFNSVGTYTTGDAAQTAFAKGETVRVKVAFEMADYYWSAPSYYYFATGESYRVIYTIVDGDGMPVYFYSTTGTINQAQVVNAFVDYASSPSATAGTYTVKAYLWSDWLPAGNALAPSGGSATFTIS